MSIFILIGAGVCAYLIITKDAVLDKDKLATPKRNITLYDDEGNEIISTVVDDKHKFVSVNDLKDSCINAFIASEDRTFYKHNGLNYKRMVKALFTNIASRSFKEGASTISQQLIKNTHLSQDKTIKRKLNEIRLTKQLEREYEKDEILEMYLNTIYFGHNCYGLQSASEFYFDKKAEALELTESATLVGLLSSPNNYSPFKNPEKSLTKRNLVLKSMLECGFIGESEYEQAKNQPLNAKKSDERSSEYSDFVSAVFDELGDIDVNVYDLYGGCKIKTYLNPDLQSFIENLQFDCDNSIVITSREGGVNAFKSTVGEVKRQPGSTVKPLFVYAPALDEKILSPFTRILDEKIDYNGYSPENYDKKYHGLVTVKESIANSYNVPAVKTLNALSVGVAERYITRMNIALDEEEKNLSLALGGMRYGLTLKQLADLYGTFANGGIYSPSRFIKEIISADGKTVYKHEPTKSRVFSEGASSLMNEMLIETSKSGTAKKLAKFDFDVASKTGTCGNEDGNTDAYAISYTSAHRLGVWLGDKDNKKLNVTGGNQCCTAMKSILKKLYQTQKPQNLDKDSGTVTAQIDAEEYYFNNKIVLADKLSPKLNILSVKVLQGNEPRDYSTRFSHPTIQKPAICVKNSAVNISLYQTKYYSYVIKRGFGGNFEVIYDGEWKQTIVDEPPSGQYVYTVTPYFLNGENKIFGREISLPTVSVNIAGDSPQVKIPDIAKDEWYNL